MVQKRSTSVHHAECGRSCPGTSAMACKPTSQQRNHARALSVFVCGALANGSGNTSLLGAGEPAGAAKRLDGGAQSARL